MTILQRALTTIPALIIINYSKKTGEIIITADVNLER
jgi:hypothetical protein